MNDPSATPAPAAPDEPEGIGGWLILVAIGLVVQPIRLIVLVVQNVSHVTPETWRALTTPGGQHYRPLWATVYAIEMVVNLVLVLGSLWLIYLFVTKRRIFPNAAIGYMCASITFQILDLFAAGVLLDLPTDRDDYKSLAQSMVSGAIWIPYLLKSRRVKNTFVEPRDQAGREETTSA